MSISKLECYKVCFIVKDSFSGFERFQRATMQAFSGLASVYLVTKASHPTLRNHCTRAWSTIA